MGAEREQAEVLERIAARERERAALLAERDTLVQQLELRDKLRIFEEGKPPPREGSGVRWGLWLAAFVMAIATGNCSLEAHHGDGAAEAAGQL